MLRRLVFLLETAVLLGALAGVNYWLVADKPGFAGVNPHPYYAVMLLITVRYGFTPGLVAAFAASALYFTQLLIGIEVPSWRNFLAVDYSMPMVVLTGGAGVVGLIVDRHLRQIQRLRAELGGLRKEKQSLETDQAQLRDVNAELAGRIVGAESTLPALYRYARLLNTSDINQIYAGLITILREAMHADAAGVYAVGKMAATRRIHGEGPDELPLTGVIRDRLLQSGGVVTLQDLPEPGPAGPAVYLAGALRAGTDGPIKAVLTVNRISFLRYNGATIRLFHVLVDWAAGSIDSAIRVAAMPEAERAAKLEQAAASSRRVAEKFARTQVLAIDDVELLPDESTGSTVDGFLGEDPTDASPADSPQGVPLAPMHDAPVARRRHGQLAGPTPGPVEPMTDLQAMFDEGESVTEAVAPDGSESGGPDASGDGSLSAAMAAEIGRHQGFKRREFVTLLANLSDYIDSQPEEP